MKGWTHGILAGAMLSMLTACGIPKDEHAAVVKDLENTQLELSESQRQRAEQDSKLKELEGLILASNERITQKQAEIKTLQQALDEANGELKLYADVKGDLEKALAASKTELADLRQARARAEARAAQYRKLTEKLASMVRSGKLTVKIRNGKMVIQLPNNVLFDPGKSKLKDAGSEALVEVAAILKDFERNYLIAGHTDNVPISSGRYASNWALSTARAVEVVTFLQENGVSPKKIAAAGYGEFDPVASNETDEGKALNRRIEIILMPNLDELPQIPKDVLGDNVGS